MCEIWNLTLDYSNTIVTGTNTSITCTTVLLRTNLASQWSHVEGGSKFSTLPYQYSTQFSSTRTRHSTVHELYLPLYDLCTLSFKQKFSLIDSTVVGKMSCSSGTDFRCGYCPLDSEMTKRLTGSRQLPVSGRHQATTKIIVGFLSNLDLDIICQALLPYLTILTDLVNLSHSSKLFRDIIFSGRTSSIWSNNPVDICINYCKFGCGRTPISTHLAWSILRYTSVVSIRLHMPFNRLGLLLESVIGNQLQMLRRLHLRFRVDDDADITAKTLLLEREESLVPMRQLNMAELTIYGYPNSFVSTGCLELLLSIFGRNLETLQFMETSPIGVLKTLQSNICPVLSNLTIQGEQLLDDLMGLKSDTLKFLSLRDTSIKLSGRIGVHETLQFSHLTRLELIDKVDSSNRLWRTANDINEGMSVLPPSLKEIELRIDSRLANPAIIELSKRLCKLQTLSLQLPDKDENGPDDISFSAIAALKHGCPYLIVLEITDGLIGFDVDAFIALKDFTFLKRIKLLYDDSIVDLLPRLLEESADSIEDVQFYENAGDIFNEEDGSARWHAMEERLEKMSAVFTCVNIGLSDYWWP